MVRKFTKNEKPTFPQVGDWCICEYKVQQITQMEHARVEIVSDGHCSMGGHDITVWPLTRENKAYADMVSCARAQLNTERGSHMLNWPDLHRAMCDYCNAILSLPEGDAARQRNAEDFRKFVSEVTEALRDARCKTVGGVAIFGR